MTDEELWNEFHQVVNMSSRELAEWLRTESASPRSEPEPEHAGSVTGQQVLHILRKRKADLTDDDLGVMRHVIDRVRAERRDDLEPAAGDSVWRHQLMDLGHDPLRAVE